MVATIAMAIFTALGVGTGIAFVTWPKAVADFFTWGAKPLYSEKFINKAYTPRNARATGMGFIVFGAVAFAIFLVLIFGGYALEG